MRKCSGENLSARIKILFFQRVSERHNLDITVKYSFVPQTDPPYQLDKSTPEIDFAEPHMVNNDFNN